MPRIRTISGKNLIKELFKIGFILERQTGSHVIIGKTCNGRYFTTVVPLHDPVAKGTLSNIYKDVAKMCTEKDVKSIFFSS